MRDEKRTQPERVWQAHGAAKKKTMANIERSAAVILAHVEGIRRKPASAGNIAVGVAERVIAEKRKLRSHSNAAVHNELVLLEDSFGLILENIIGAIGPIARNRIRRIQIGGEKLMESARG